ncbi:hypothetical protein OC25_03355 [Pedobacter kyungheensis]|uniref:Outer membrane protein beta-barrel domain-containing protein n=1 Tax=Pedobacter kyungheensis TaxID=1069985 RepID=A0A0C1FTB0_9SPHI|nr:outer membrane beta-barrel protein [Pedobacter kyungheensis]KIA96142.1 hypothetical protein OC25_03355 [Pedobacter kyungheensis]
MRITFSLLLTLLWISGYAQTKFQHSITIGYNIGGLAPTSLPDNIRKINHYSPGFSPSLGYELIYHTGSKWAIGSGLNIGFKNMQVIDSVQYFHTQVSVDDAFVEGDFSGTNTTRVKNLYLSVPVYASYQLGEAWRFKLGVYLSRLISPSFSGSVSDGYLRKGDSFGEKITINEASFDFSDRQRKIDFGLLGGAERLVWNQLAVRAELQWGLVPVFPGSFKGISFKMYNIFANLGLAYHF